MCGGISYKIKNIPAQDLAKYYSPALVKRFQAAGRAEAFFWEKTAVLPVMTKSGIQLKLWGNKDETIRLPKTGWARAESLAAGKWDHLHPEPVDIPADRGYEKKTWFDFRAGTRGLLVRRGDAERVYMITEEASDEYREATGHDREPPGEKSGYQRPSK